MANFPTKSLTIAILLKATYFGSAFSSPIQEAGCHETNVKRNTNPPINMTIEEDTMFMAGLILGGMPDTKKMNEEELKFWETKMREKFEVARRHNQEDRDYLRRKFEIFDKVLQRKDDDLVKQLNAPTSMAEDEARKIYEESQVFEKTCKAEYRTNLMEYIRKVRTGVLRDRVEYIFESWDKEGGWSG